MLMDENSSNLAQRCLQTFHVLLYNAACKHVMNSASFFKIKLSIFFGYFDPENIFLDNENK